METQKVRVGLVAMLLVAAALGFWLWRDRVRDGAGQSGPPAEQPAETLATDGGAQAQVARAAGIAEQQPTPREEVAGIQRWHLRGVVRATGAVAIEGAKVEAYRARPQESAGWFEAAFAEIAMDRNAAARHRAILTYEGDPIGGANVAADGSFELRDLPSRHVKLALVHDHWGLRQPELADAGHDATVVLTPYLGGCVHGVVAGLAEPGGIAVELEVDLDPMLVLRDPTAFSATMMRAFAATERSDPAGRWRFRAVLPAARLRVRIESDEHCGRSDPFALAAGETREVVLQARPGVTAQLRVRDERGQAIAGAHVKLEQPAEGMVSNVVRRRAPTGADGTAELRALLPGRYELEVAAADHVTHHESIELPPSGLTRDVVLDDGGSIEGIVVDAQQTPVAGAGVQVVPVVEIPLLGDVGNLVGDDLFAQAARDAPCRTGADGRFRLGGLAGDGERSLAVAHPEFLPLLQPKVRPGDRDLRIVLQPGARVTGRVVHGPERQPVADFEVQTVVTMALVMERPSRILPVTGSSDGTFRLERVPPGRATLRIRAPGFAPLERPIAPTAGATLDVGLLELVAGATVRGSVVGPDDAPIAGASVRVARGGVGDNPLFAVMTGQRHATTDERGRFELGGLEGGALALVADAPGCAPSRSDRLRIPPAGTIEGVRIRMRAGGTIVGRLLLPDGRSATGWSISAGTMLGDGIGTADPAPDGTFRIEHLVPGSYRVQAFDTAAYTELSRVSERSLRDGGAEFASMLGELIGKTVQAQVTVRDGETSEVELDATELESESAPVTVAVLLGGRPLAEGWVEATAQAGGRKLLGLVTAGRAELKGIAPGRHVLQVRRGWMMAPLGSAVPIDVAAGGTREFEIRLEGGSIAGRVLDAASGEPVGGAAVRIRGEQSVESPAEFGFELTDPHGRFAIEGLAPGVYSLSADEALAPRAGIAGRIDGIRLEPGEQRAGLVLHAGRSVAAELQVVDRTLAPIAGALALAIDEHGTPVGSFAYAFTDHEGRAAFTALPAGPVRFAVRADGFAPGVSELQQVVRGQDLRFRVELGTGVPVHVRVEDPRGGIARGAIVSCRFGAGPWLPSFLLQRPSGGDEIDLGPLPPGRVQLRVSLPGRLPFEVERAVAGGARTTWTIVLPAR